MKKIVTKKLFLKFLVGIIVFLIVYVNFIGKSNIVIANKYLLEKKQQLFEIDFSPNGSTVYNADSNESTIVTVSGGGTGDIASLNYVWSKSNTSVPTLEDFFKGTFKSGDRISKQVGSKALYLWIRACDQVNNCNISVSNAFVGNLINNDISIRPRLTESNCGYFSTGEIAALNQVLSSRVSNAETKREKVVAAAKFLAIELPVQIPYYLNEGLNTKKGRFYQEGLFLYPAWGNNQQGEWGCKVTRQKENTTTSTTLGFLYGNSYPNGFDCSGFLSWAFLNGGVELGDLGSGNYSNLPNTTKISIGNNIQTSNNLKIGNIVSQTGHVGIIIDNDTINKTITLAESAGKSGSGGVKATKWTYDQVKNGKTTFTDILVMDKIYDDITNPTVSISGNTVEWTLSKTLTIIASDNEAGLADKPYSFDGGVTWTDTKTKTYTSNQTVNIWVKDAVGNISKKSIVIDKIGSDILTNIPIGMTVEDFDLGLDDTYITKIFDRSNVRKTTGRLATGDKVRVCLKENSKEILVVEYIVIIKGDVRGTGNPTVSDVAKLYQYLRGKITMEDYFIKAGNVVDTDNEIKINDVAKLYQFIRGKIENLNINLKDSGYEIKILN